jgi:hypothetical protein
MTEYLTKLGAVQHLRRLFVAHSGILRRSDFGAVRDPAPFGISRRYDGTA